MAARAAGRETYPSPRPGRTGGAPAGAPGPGAPGCPKTAIYHQTVHHLHVHGPAEGGQGITRVVCDGVEQPDRTIPLRDDGVEHHAEISVGAASVAG